MKNFIIKVDNFIKGPKGILRSILSRFSAGLAFFGILLGIFHSPGFRFIASGVSYYAVRLDNFVRVLQDEVD